MKTLDVQKSKLIFIVLFVIGFICFWQKGITQLKCPPGTLQLNDSVYIDATPVLNIHYKEYLNFMKNVIRFNIDSFDAVTGNLPYFNFNLEAFIQQTEFEPNPDSLNYIIEDTVYRFCNNWTIFSHYLSHSYFNYYPLVNVNVAIASAFCRWRTNMVMFAYASEKKEKERKKYHKAVNYRLATTDELQSAVKKFKTDNLLVYQEKASYDSIVSFNNAEKAGKVAVFRIAHLNELAKNGSNIFRGYWDNDSASFIPGPLIKNTAIAENLTFRCICDVKN